MTFSDQSGAGSAKTWTSVSPHQRVAGAVRRDFHSQLGHPDAADAAAAAAAAHVGVGRPAHGGAGQRRAAGGLGVAAQVGFESRV